MSYDKSPNQTSLYDKMLLDKPRLSNVYKHTIPIILCILLIIAGIIIIVVVIEATEDDSVATPFTKDDWKNMLLNQPSTEETKRFSERLARDPHIAGYPETFEIGYYVAEQFKEFGLEYETENISDIYLSTFISASLSIVLENGTIIPFDLEEKVIINDTDTDVEERFDAFNAYSASGNVTADLIYINFGRDVDYQFLITNHSFEMSDFEGKIGLVRYGNLGRSRKVLNAERYGLKGLIMFNDPLFQEDIDEGYPDGQWRSRNSFERGSIAFADCPGNRLPSRLMEYCNQTETEALPNIPVIPLSWGNAMTLLSYMSPGLIIDEWQGLLSENFGVDYTVSGLDNNASVSLIVNQERERKTIMNVYGWITGDKYPNEVVIMGAHRDAWVKGACDDVSGTTTMLEIARSLGVLYDNGWRPYRTIYFGSWDGEEHGLIGSVEFGENIKRNFTNDNVIAYINMDMTTIGENFQFASDPLLRMVGLEAAGELTHPYNDTTTLKENMTFVPPRTVTSGSDFAVFQYHNSIPTMDIAFQKIPGGISGSGTYHSAYDTIKWQETVDPEWKYAQGIAKYGALLAFKLIYYDVIPFDVTDLAVAMTRWVNDIPNDFSQYVEACNLEPDFLKELDSLISSSFMPTALEFQSAIDNLDETADDYAELLSKYNAKLKDLLKQFITPEGMPNSKWWKNSLMMANPEGSYYVFPLITKTLQATQCDSISDSIQQTIALIIDAVAYLDLENI